MKKIITVSNMRQSDENTIRNGTLGRELMFRAAQGVYKSYNWFGKIGIFCGSGNNAGDGYALALILKHNNFSPTIILTSNKFSNDGKYFYDLCVENGIIIIDFKEINETFDIAVDCLLGTGFKGKVKDDIIEVINYINNTNIVISVDINSGLNGDNGLSDYCVKSDLTVSIGYLKPGLYLNQAKDYMKEIVNIDIGIDNIEKEFYLIEEEDVRKLIKKRLNYSNKGTYGYVGIMGGSQSYPGAIRLANLGQTSLYSGCGVSRLIVPKEIYNLIFNNVLETTVYPIDSIDGKMIYNETQISDSIKGLKVLGIGVGWDQSLEYQNILQFIIRNTSIPLVIDADGINTLSQMDLNILNENNNIILTPHLKEFSRLTNYTIQEIRENSVEIIKEFVNKYNITLLLKGPTTIVANKDNMYFINTGCSGMGTAGSGDVLTGIIVGMLGYSNESLDLTVSIAAYINGLAGEYASKQFGKVGMVSSDTARNVALVIKDLIGE